MGDWSKGMNEAREDAIGVYSKRIEPLRYDADEQTLLITGYVDGWDAREAQAVSLPDRNALFEAIADRLGEHEKAYNEFDPSDEPVTCITLKGVPVETLAEFIAPAVLAALSTQPAAGEVEWGVCDPGEFPEPYLIGSESEIRAKVHSGSSLQIAYRTKAGPWIEVQL